MDLLRRFMLPTALWLVVANAYAGQDPIGWAMTGSLPAIATLNHSYSINFTLTNNLPFKMPTPLLISNNSSPASEVTLVDNCSGLKLQSKQSCNVGLVLTPKTVGTKSLSLYMEYGSNKVLIPRTPLTTQVLSNVNATIQANVTVGLPTSILSNTTYPLTFQFVNNSSTTATSVSVTPAAGNTPGLTITSTTCGSTLGSTPCTSTGSYTTSASSGAVSLGLTIATSLGNATATTSSIVNNNTNLKVRTITFVNDCSQPVWFGLVGGAVNGNPCTSDSDCASGSLCNPSANSGAGECFYVNPVPLNGTYELTTSGGGKTNTVSVTDYGLQYVWSGNIAARTGSSCATGTCDTADCQSGGGDNGCPVGVGFTQPATLAEFTLQRATIDSYDVSIINGMNVGVEVTPSTSGTFTAQGNPSYNCQSPGNPAAVPSLGLGACNWTSGFTPPNYPTSSSASSYVYVKAPGSPVTCGPSGTSDPDCSHQSSPNTTCGLSFNSTAVTLSKVCGQFLGYISADQVCSFANTNIAPGNSNNPGDAYFPCDTAITNTGDLANFTYWALYACKAQANGDLGTCYNGPDNKPVSTTNCCGCVDWQTVGGGIVVPSSTTTCVKENSSWTSVSTGVLPGIEWLKEACPTAYSYPFDDKASSFGCMDINAGNTVNTINYTITFCPT